MIESCIYFMYRIYVSRAIKGIRRENAITAFEPSIPPCPTLHAALHGIWHGCWVQNLKATCTNTMKPKTSRHGTRWVDHGWPLMDVDRWWMWIPSISAIICTDPNPGFQSFLLWLPDLFPQPGMGARWGAAGSWQGMLLFCGGFKVFCSHSKNQSTWFYMILRFWCLCDLFLALIVWIPLDFHSLKPEQW